MDDLPFDHAPAGAGVRWALFAAWAAAAAFLVAHHVVWRDEVRALTLALAGDGWAGMWQAVRGEGHPVLWYALLHAVHDLVAVPQVLPAVGALVGFLAAALFAWRAPFRAGVIALVLFSGFVLVEYTVIARNYGIAMLLMFALAALQPGRGWAEGLLLAALANTSVPAVIFVVAWLVFRAIEAVSERRGFGALTVATLLAGLRVAACFVTVYPPVNDAAVPPTDGLGIAVMLHALTGVAQALYTLVPPGLEQVPGIAAILSILLLASPLSLIRSPGGFVAAAAALGASVLFFGLLYPGSYRHHALYLAFLFALHWAVAEGRGGTWALARSALARPAQWLAVALLALQLPIGMTALASAATGRVYSHSRDLAAILRRPEYRRAIVIAAPDYLVEPLAYYVDNPAWLVREQRLGRTVRYTRHLIVNLSLGRVLADAQALKARTGRLIVLAIRPDLDDRKPTSEQDGYVTTFTTTPAEVRAFRRATVPIARLKGAQTDENYSVYRLR